MKFSATAFAALLPAVTSALAVRSEEQAAASKPAVITYKPHNPQRLASRQSASTSWELYEQESEELMSEGLCRNYMNDQPERGFDGAAMCEDHCEEGRELLVEDQQQFLSWSCFVTGQNLPEQSDPDGYYYRLGQCICDNPVLDWFANDVFIGSLPAIGQTTCAVIKIVAYEAKDYAFAPSAATKIFGKAAQTIIETVGNSQGWEDFVRSRVEDSSACDFSPEQLFEDLVELELP